ncbi:MAG: cyclic nucleotide-binding domain-containing protein [Bryobacteraceae bacterium]|nr:cyclic nucleotide-binding domain-containing protein [Bryobacteraceae bacterium]
MRKALIFLGILDDMDIEWIIRTGLKRSVPDGTILIEEKKALDSLFFVLDGEFEVYIGNGKGIALLRAGEVLGEMSFVDSRPPSASVRARRESVVLVISRHELRAKLEEDTGFAARFYRSIAAFLTDRLRTTTSRLGYGEKLRLDEEVEDLDEVAPDFLDSMALAGTRFEELLRRLSGASLQTL